MPASCPDVGHEPNLSQPGFPPDLTPPLPVANFFFIDAFGVGIGDALDDLSFQPFLDVSADRAQARNAVNDIDSQVKAIDLVEDGKLQRGIDIALLLVSPHMNVVMVPAPIAELVDE